MRGLCTLCGYDGEICSTTKQSDLYVCLLCYDKFYCEKEVEEKGGEDMSWGDVDAKSGKRDPDVLEIAPNTTKLAHVLLPDTEDPVSYWTHYIPNKSPTGPKGAVVICPGKSICPACASGTYRTKRVHAINVWDYESKGVKILEGGNSIFQPLKQIRDQIGTLLSVNISIKRMGSGIDTTYSVIPIPMMSPFDQSQIRGVFPILELRIPNTVEKVATVIENMGWSVKTPATQAPEQGTPPVFEAEPPSTLAEPVLQFGKYKGRTMLDVFGEDPNYVKWCAENITDPRIKAAAKNIVEAAKSPAAINQSPAVKGILSDTTQTQLLINEINEIFQEDERYIGKFALIIEKMKAASISPTHPNGKTILGEYTLDELEKLVMSIK